MVSVLPTLGDALKVFNDAINSGSLRYADFHCGDKVYTVSFTPMEGNEFLNVYALDTTEKAKAARDLHNALIEVRQLKDRLFQENRYLQEEITLTHGLDSIRRQ